MNFVRHPRARRYVIRVRPDGTVRITLPRWGSRRHARDFAEEQRAWIERQQRRIAESRESAVERPATEVRELRPRPAPQPPPRLYALARQYRLDVAKVSVRNQQYRWGSCSP